MQRFLLYFCAFALSRWLVPGSVLADAQPLMVRASVGYGYTFFTDDRVGDDGRSSNGRALAWEFSLDPDFQKDRHVRLILVVQGSWVPRAVFKIDQNDRDRGRLVVFTPGLGLMRLFDIGVSVSAFVGPALGFGDGLADDRDNIAPGGGLSVGYERRIGRGIALGITGLVSAAYWGIGTGHGSVMLTLRAWPESDDPEPAAKPPATDNREPAEPVAHPRASAEP